MQRECLSCSLVVTFGVRIPFALPSQPLQKWRCSLDCSFTWRLTPQSGTLSTSWIPALAADTFSDFWLLPSTSHSNLRYQISYTCNWPSHENRWERDNDFLYSFRPSSSSSSYIFHLWCRKAVVLCMVDIQHWEKGGQAYQLISGEGERHFFEKVCVWYPSNCYVSILTAHSFPEKGSHQNLEHGYRCQKLLGLVT